MARVVDARLDVDQALQINPVHIRFTALASDSTPPRLVEVEGSQNSVLPSLKPMESRVRPLPVPLKCRQE